MDRITFTRFTVKTCVPKTFECSIIEKTMMKLILAFMKGADEQFMDRERHKKILEILEKHYKGATTALKYKTPFQLLIATILSAQCTDRQVNKITSKLFQKYPGPEDFARLSPEELEKDIYSCGFYRNKSRNIVKTSQILLKKYGGQVPQSIEELQELPGVGRMPLAWTLLRWIHTCSGFPTGWGWPMQKPRKKLKDSLWRIYQRISGQKLTTGLYSTAEGYVLPAILNAINVFLQSIVNIITVPAPGEECGGPMQLSADIYSKGGFSNGYPAGITKTS